MLLSPVAKATRDVICDVINIMNAVSKAKAKAAYNLYRLDYFNIYIVWNYQTVQMVISVLGCPFFLFLPPIRAIPIRQNACFRSSQVGAFFEF